MPTSRAKILFALAAVAMIGWLTFLSVMAFRY